LSGRIEHPHEKEDDMHKQITLASILVCGLALLAVPGALADRAYSDPAGDSGTAPDVTAVRTTHDSAGTITFSATTNQPALASDASVYVYVDSDRNPATGLPVRGLGADHFFSHDGEFVFHVNGNFLAVDFTSTLATSYAAGTLTARINRSDLGNTDKFAFLIEAERDDEDDSTPNDADFAPDSGPFFEYSLVAIALTVGKPVAVAGKPVAGGRFMLTAPVRRSDGQPFTAGTVTCKAKAGGVPLSARGRVVAGAARCSMRIPKSAKAKMLRGSLTVSGDDAPAVIQTFAYRIA
jgi:hypothetical protein